MEYKVYVLRSVPSSIYYIGQTSDFESRLRSHNSGYNRYTKGKGPWEVYFIKDFETRSEAMAFERKLKNLKSRVRLENYLEEYK